MCDQLRPSPKTSDQQVPHGPGASPLSRPLAAIKTFWEKTFRHRSVAAQLEVLNEEGEPRYRPIDRKMVSRLLICMKPYRRQYLRGLVFGIIMILLEMQSPRFIGAIINWTTNYATGRIAPMPTESAAIRHVAGIIALWAAVLGIAMVMQRLTILAMTDAGEKVQFDLRRQLFAHLQGLSMSFYDRTRLGRLISRCSTDLNSLREINVWGIHTVTANSLMMCMATIMLLRTEPRLFLAVVWLGPVLFALNRAYRRKAAIMYQIAREGFTRVSTNLAENITGVRVVTAFNRQSYNLGLFDRLQDVNTINNVNCARLNGIYQPLLGLVGFTGRAIILLYGGYLVTTDRIDRHIGVGCVVTAFLYWDWFMAPIVNFGNFYNQLMMAMAGGERVFTLLDTQPEIRDVPDAAPIPSIRGHVEFRNVTFGYKPDRPILHEISFEAMPGEVIALVGPTGCGKSSIISLIARFYLPQKGTILVDGHDIRNVQGKSLHRQMGLVLQSNYLFTGTVMDNIRYGYPAAGDKEVIEAARRLGTYDNIVSLKNGFQTEVGERGANMSLGQRQLICLTRAYLANPRIFMLDEATSSVDTATEQQIQRSLERLLQGRTTFIVAHRLSTIQRADHILVIDQGRIIERGTHWELIERDGRYAQLHEQFVLSTS